MLRRVPREFWLFLAILLLGAFIHARNARSGFLGPSDFLSTTNLTSLAKQVALLGIFALGAGIIIIAGGIDLSSGSVICFAGVIGAMIPRWSADYLGRWVESAACPAFLGELVRRAGLTVAEEPYSIAMLGFMVVGTLLVGLAVGCFHGLLINKLDLPPFIATLGTMAGLRSLASVITTGTIAVSDARFRALGKTWYVPVALFLVECVALGVVMRWTRLGRYLLAMGGNEQAAHLSGLAVGRLKLFAYCLGSTTAALAGLVYLAHLGSASSQTGIGYELAAIAAAVVGGCNLKGGAGSILGILLGVVLLRVVVNGTLFVIEVQATEWEGFIVGLVVILAVLLGKVGSR